MKKLILVLSLLCSTTALACPGGQPHCEGAQGSDEATCEDNGGHWVTPRGGCDATLNEAIAVAPKGYECMVGEELDGCPHGAIRGSCTKDGQSGHYCDLRN